MLPTLLLSLNDHRPTLDLLTCIECGLVSEYHFQLVVLIHAGPGYYVRDGTRPAGR